MGITDAYLVTTKNLEAIFNAIQSAQAPDRFTQKFLEHLGFTSSNDRLYIKLLKSLNFLDDSGVPTQRYYEFLDQGQARAVLAEGITEAYSDLFTLNRKAYALSPEEVQNKLKTLTQGKKSDNILRWMANTFVALCEYADWEGLERRKGRDNEQAEAASGFEGFEEPEVTSNEGPRIQGGLHYNIQIHLPESRDAAVFDAIFSALRRHLR